MSTDNRAARRRQVQREMRTLLLRFARLDPDEHGQGRCFFCHEVVGHHPGCLWDTNRRWLAEHRQDRSG